MDHARKSCYAKRGGDAMRIPLEDRLLGTRAHGVEVLALNEALELLAKVDPRKGRIWRPECGGDGPGPERLERNRVTRLENGGGVVVSRTEWLTSSRRASAC